MDIRSYPSQLLLQVMLIWITVNARRPRVPDYCKDIVSEGEEPGSFLWEVRRRGRLPPSPPSYLFGTIHVPYTRVWDHVPVNAKRAFYSADIVYFELDLRDPYTISALTACQLLPKGGNLSEVLPKSLYQRLRSHLAYVRQMMASWVTQDQKGRGLHADNLFSAITGNWERKRPVWVMLMVNSLTKGDVRSRGVPVLDLFLAQEADRLKKETGAVEKVHEQCLPLNTLNSTQGIFALNHTLSQQESLRQGLGPRTHSTDDLIKHYNCGRLDDVIVRQDATQTSSLTVPHLNTSSLPPAEAETASFIDDYFQEKLILRRNERMGRRVAQILNEHPDQVIFFAFGAGHFLGNHTVIDVVSSYGFDVDRIGHYQKIKRRKRKRGEKRRLVPKMQILRNFSMFPRALEPDQQTDPAFARFLSERGDRKSQASRKFSSPTSSLPDRPFNELWIPLDPSTKDHRISHMDGARAKDAKALEDSLRIWYGLPPGNKGPSFTVNMFSQWWIIGLLLTLR